MDKMQSKQHTLREETLTHNTLNCMVCLKKHPINKISVIKKVQSYETWTVIVGYTENNDVTLKI